MKFWQHALVNILVIAVGVFAAMQMDGFVMSRKVKSEE